MPKASKPKTVAELRDIPMKENLGKIPVWRGSSNHCVQPTTIVTKQPRTGRINMQWVAPPPKSSRIRNLSTGLKKIQVMREMMVAVVTSPLHQ
jgi:hypothetical protein